jgi:serine/threonine protein kinase
LFPNEQKKKTAWCDSTNEIVITFYVRARDAAVPIDCTKAVIVRDAAAGHAQQEQVCSVERYDLKRVANPGAAMKVAEGMLSFSARFMSAPGTYRVRFGPASEWKVSEVPVLVIPPRSTLAAVFYRGGVNEVARAPDSYAWVRRRLKPLTPVPGASNSPVLSVPPAATAATVAGSRVSPAPRVAGVPTCAFCRAVARVLPANCDHAMCPDCNKRMMIDAVRHHQAGMPSPAYCPVAQCGIPLSLTAAAACLQPDELAFYDACCKGTAMPTTPPPRSLSASFSTPPPPQTLPIGYGSVPGEHDSPVNLRPSMLGYEATPPPASAYDPAPPPVETPSPAASPRKLSDSGSGASNSGRRPTLQRNDRQKNIPAPAAPVAAVAPVAATSGKTHAYGSMADVPMASNSPVRRMGTTATALPVAAPARAGAGAGAGAGAAAPAAAVAARPQAKESVYGDAPAMKAVESTGAYGEAPPEFRAVVAAPQKPPAAAAEGAYGPAPTKETDMRKVSRSAGDNNALLGNSTGPRGRDVALSDSNMLDTPLPSSMQHPPPPFDDDLPPPPDEAAATPPPSPPPSPPGEGELDARFQIGADEFQRFEKIGEGFSGVVYRGVWRHTAVAIKELKNSDNAKMVADFRAEARQLVALRPHTNVAQLFGVCLRPLALVCAFYPRGSLDKWLKQQPAPLSDAATLRMLLGIASGVYHLHAEGVVHRDLAARNVLLGDGDVPKLTDFGMAREASEGVTLQTSSDSGMPLKWMAPEQLNRNIRAYSSASDVWAFGIVCVEVLTRQPPWAGVTASDAAVRTLKGERMALPKHTPPFLRDLVAACWRLQPEQRPNMDACHAVLAEHAVKIGVNLSESASASAAAAAKAGTATLGGGAGGDGGDAPQLGPPEIDVKELRFDVQSDLIGEGTYGKVYRGVCRGQPVAIKVPQHQELNEQQLADFRNEVAIMRRIFHPNVVLFLGAHSAPGSIMLVSEFLDGGDLDHVLHSESEIPPARKLSYMMDTAKAMNWLHGINGIVHRDLKPANLLTDDAHRVKVTDFGFSQLRQTEDAQLQDAQGPKGSALWMAPEVFLRRPFTASIDVYAFGLIMWEIWNRQWLFPHHSDLAEFRRAITVNRERPPMEPGMCAPSLAALMQRCWAHAPEDRPTFAEVLPLLEVARADSLLPLPYASPWWQRYIGASVTQVEWPLFSSQIAASTNMPRSVIEILKPYVVDEKDVKQRVTIELFAAACEKLGAFYGPGASHIQWVVHLLRQPQFHGDVEREEVDRRLKGRPAGMYLVRFGGKQDHPFTISVASSQGAQHKRVHHVWGSNVWMILIDGKTLTFPTFHDLLQARECKLGQPCPKPSPSQPIYQDPYDTPDVNK